MSRGAPANPTATNTTAALIASPPGVRSIPAVGRPICRVITPTTGTQTAVPPGV